MTYSWDDSSTYIQLPPYFAGMAREPADRRSPTSRVRGSWRCSATSITTDHISPAGNIAKTSPAAKYLMGRGVEPKDFNQYGARRGSHDVMMRGTFANIRIKNEMLGGKEGGLHQATGPTGTEMSIYDAAMAYKKRGVPLVVIGGKEYGTGSSRDWAAKGTNLLGVKAVLAESFERIHRSNLVGMGVLPLVFKDGTDRKSVGLDGSEIIDILGLAAGLRPAHGPHLPHHPDGRHGAGDPRAVPRRYAGRGRLLQARRHPAVRAALACSSRRGRQADA